MSGDLLAAPLHPFLDHRLDVGPPRVGVCVPAPIQSRILRRDAVVGLLVHLIVHGAPAVYIQNFILAPCLVLRRPVHVLLGDHIRSEGLAEGALEGGDQRIPHHRVRLQHRGDLLALHAHTRDLHLKVVAAQVVVGLPLGLAQVPRLVQREGRGRGAWPRAEREVEEGRLCLLGILDVPRRQAVAPDEELAHPSRRRGQELLRDRLPLVLAGIKDAEAHVGEGLPNGDHGSKLFRDLCGDHEV
mmetsp:Transcript_3881/g.9263  ORF Transcript_3881/g.9263 Transcript_3881/m.9263 type:complete len:243 (+) Transcript_3881:2887-3615(+)